MVEYKYIKKKDYADFVSTIRDVLSESGFTQDPDFPREWSIESNVGHLKVSLWDYSKTEIWSIFTRFKNPVLAKETWNFDCNTYSGKFNFHYRKNERVEIVEYFKYFIHLVTKKLEK